MRNMQSRQKNMLQQQGRIYHKRLQIAFFCTQVNRNPSTKENAMENRKIPKPGPTNATLVKKLGNAKEVQWVPANPTMAPPIAPDRQAASIGRSSGTLTPNSAGSVTPKAAVRDA